METEFEIEGMSCEHCVKAVDKALRAIPGVRDARVRVGHAVLVSDAAITRDTVDKALDEEGFRLKR